MDRQEIVATVVAAERQRIITATVDTLLRHERVDSLRDAVEYLHAVWPDLRAAEFIRRDGRLVWLTPEFTRYRVDCTCEQCEHLRAFIKGEPWL